MIDRGDYWQCAYVIRKGAADEIKAQGLEAFRDAIVGYRAAAARSRAGAARAGTTSSSSPSRSIACRGGIGRACCASAMRRTRCRRSAASASTSRSRTRWRRPTVWPRRCAREPLSEDDLAAVQRRRTFPTRVTQRIQVFIQNNVLSRVLASRGTLVAALAGAAARRLPDVAAHSGAADRPGHQARTCAGAAGDCATAARLTIAPPVGAIPIGASQGDASC